MQSDLKEKFEKHLLTLFYRHDELLTLNEQSFCKYHINAMHDIEKQLTNYGINYCTPNGDSLEKFAFHCISCGNILIANISISTSDTYIFFIPEYNDELNANIIEQSFIVLDGCNITLSKKHGEKY